MTADSLPSRTAAHGVEPKPALDACLVADLTAGVHGRARERQLRARPSRFDVEAIERAFGRHIRDERVRSGVRAARARTARLVDAAGAMSEALALTFAADLFVSIAVERSWESKDVENVNQALGEVLEATPTAVAVKLLNSCVRAPQLYELPPMLALEVQLSMLVALSSVVEASLWVRDESGRPECVLAFGETATTRRFRSVAAKTMEKGGSGQEPAQILGLPVRRWQTPWGALVIRTSNATDAGASAHEVADAFSPLLEREFLLRRSAERERSLVTASERRLSRLGFDLHDGALQHVAALGSDLRRLRSSLSAEGQTGSPALSLDALDESVTELDRTLRELAHSLEPASLLRRPLERVIEAEASSLRERTDMRVQTHVTGDFAAMTASQKIALIRVVQEALTNIREHSNASEVVVRLLATRGSVDLHISDDGDGFEVTRTLQDAAQRGRLGLVGSNERIRLLGGSFDIRSRPGGPTSIAVTLPRWQPIAADEPLELAY